jgi:hypothetical protein
MMNQQSRVYMQHKSMVRYILGPQPNVHGYLLLLQNISLGGFLELTS